MGSPGESVQSEEDNWIAEKERDAWTARPFARTFDLIAKNYGWTDDQILDLTLVRMRQIREVIFEREAETRRQSLSDKETELRILASYTARSNEALKSAQRIALLARPKDKPVLPDFDRAMSLFGAPGMDGIDEGDEA